MVFSGPNTSARRAASWSMHLLFAPPRRPSHTRQREHAGDCECASQQRCAAADPQVRHRGCRASRRWRTLFTEQILVVNQKAKLFERKAEYSVFSQYGHMVGGVRQFGTSMSRMVVGRDNVTKRLQIVDAGGGPILTLISPGLRFQPHRSLTRGLPAPRTSHLLHRLSLHHRMPRRTSRSDSFDAGIPPFTKTRSRLRPSAHPALFFGRRFPLDREAQRALCLCAELMLGE
jgi:hypothetical protein